MGGFTLLGIDQALIQSGNPLGLGFFPRLTRFSRVACNLSGSANAQIFR